jgi:tetratricopeptide (TPR) repeat protein
MKRAFCLVIVACAVALLGCSTTYHEYRSDILKGKRMLDTGEYREAHEAFTGAAKAQPAEPASYALAAAASYKMNDLQAASESIQEAAKRGKNSDAYIRILGYKTLILLRQGREREGLDALHAYIVAYEREYAPRNVREVRAMWRVKHIDLPALESLLDGEIEVYESDMQQFRSSGTGWFAAKYGPGTPGTSR